MQRRAPTYLSTMALGLFLSSSAFAVIGPQMSPLKVSQIYTKHANGTIFVAFQSGAMPGCYGNAGGYVFTNNSFFKEIHAQLLLISAMGGVRASVVYTVNASAQEWSDCTIDGIYLQPE